MAQKGAFLGYNALLGDGSYVENRPSKWQRTLGILNEYNPIPAFERLMKSPMASGGPVSEQNISDGLTVAGTVTGGSSLFPKPRNAVNMGIGNRRELQGHPKSEFEQAIKDALDLYDYVGLRTVDAPIDGQIQLSRRWVDGSPTDELLDGVSVTDVKNPNAFSLHSLADRKYNLGYYPGEYTYVLGSYNAEHGEDLGELVLKNPTLVFGGKKTSGP